MIRLSQNGWPKPFVDVCMHVIILSSRVINKTIRERSLDQSSPSPANTRTLAVATTMAPLFSVCHYLKKNKPESSDRYAQHSTSFWLLFFLFPSSSTGWSTLFISASCCGIAAIEETFSRIFQLLFVNSCTHLLALIKLYRLREGECKCQ